jgi:ParB family chromosome partitioning protein
MAEVPALVRGDLAGQPARAAMVAENLHRKDLTPLEEAGAIAELAACGWRQRKIAAEIGCSQAHISKRLALLQLPGYARDALAAGTITVADGLELHKLYGSGRDATAETVISEAVDKIGQGYRLDRVIRQAKAGLDRARAEQATREQLERDGIKLVTDQQAARAGWRRIWGRHRPARRGRVPGRHPRLPR